MEKKIIQITRGLCRLRESVASVVASPLAEGLVTRVSPYAKGRCLRFPCSQHTCSQHTKLVVKPTENDDLQHPVLDQHSFKLSICLSHDGEWGQRGFGNDAKRQQRLKYHLRRN